MSRNVELKAEVGDLAAVERRAAAAGAVFDAELAQRDVYFASPRGRLKLRRFGDGSAELIFYRRDDQTGLRQSEYHRSPVLRPAQMEYLLSRALGVLGVVEKRRRVLLHQSSRIHLDEVSGLGRFVEIETVVERAGSLEAAWEEARALAAALGIEPAATVAGSYLDLAHRARR